MICESSGWYERGFVQALVGAQLKVSLVQANRVRQFARAADILAKTDRIDAKVLCIFGEVAQPGTISASQLGTATFTRTGKSTPAFNAFAGDGTESSRTSQ